MKIFRYCFLSFVVLLCCACNESAKLVYIEETGEVFHTNYTIKYEYSRSLTNEILSKLSEFDDSLNPFKPTSIISKVNNNEEVVLDSFFVRVFDRSQQISQISRGLFDVTCSPLINAWGFGFKNMDNITPHLIDSLREFVGYQKINLRDGKIYKTDSRVQINTSAIAKGYSADVVAHLFNSLGIANYMVEIGGEIVTKGVNSGGECWRIGIDKPIDDKKAELRSLQFVLKICDKSVATSGNYRNYYIKNGKKYAHTIDPRTGYPAAGNVLAATVIADDCMTADAFATVFMLTSMDETRRIASEQGLDYLLIYAHYDGTSGVELSDGFWERYVVKQNE